MIQVMKEHGKMIMILNQLKYYIMFGGNNGTKLGEEIISAAKFFNSYSSVYSYLFYCFGQ